MSSGIVIYSEVPMMKPTVYVLLACIVVMVVFFIVMESMKTGTSEEIYMNLESADYSFSI